MCVGVRGLGVGGWVSVSSSAILNLIPYLTNNNINLILYLSYGTWYEPNLIICNEPLYESHTEVICLCLKRFCLIS